MKHLADRIEQRGGYVSEKMVICDSVKGCREAENCGGAKPHRYDSNECNKCPMNKDARCIPYVAKESTTGADHQNGI